MKNWEVIDRQHTRKVMWINHEMEIVIDYGEVEENSNFTIAMHEKLFFVDKMFYACCNFNGEIDEYYMD